MIDILLATYNSLKYLDETIESILKQDYQEWRLLIRDGGSKDNTLNIIEKYKQNYKDKIIYFPSTGTFLANTNCSQTGYDGIKIRNYQGSSVIAIIDSDAGNMKIHGSCYENYNNFAQLSGGRLVIKDESENVVAYLTNTGNLYLKGYVYDDF